MAKTAPSKIVILGISGVGKSWLARSLARRLNLPIIHYDTLCWNSHWTEVQESIVRERIVEAIRKDKWILEGYINPAGYERLDAADIVLYLDYPGWRAAWGGFRRWWGHRKTRRPELPEGCEDRWSWERLRVMWSRDERIEIEREVKDFSHKIVRLNSPYALSRYLKKFFSHE